MTKKERLEKAKEKFAAMSEYERELRKKGTRFIAGMDEVGRGPLAGPVCAACVVLPADFEVLGIDDSKKLSEKKRVELDTEIRGKALAYGIGTADNKEIDELNILNATKLAMKRALETAERMLKDSGEASGIDILLIDALTLEDVEIEQEGIIKGDSRVLSIAAASILAKVARDSFMTKMDERYPGYGFASNKGYGTSAHYDGIRQHGVTPIHRMTFLKNMGEKHGGAQAIPDDNNSRDDLSGSGRRMAKKVYAVKSGRNTGIFESWDECRAQVDGFKGAEYKSFSNMDDAWEYLGIDTGRRSSNDPGLGEMLAYVDGSYDVVSGRYSCGAVLITQTGEKTISEAFGTDDAAELRNVAGEIMGATRAIETAIEDGCSRIVIYHDYEGLARWANDEWKANLDMTREYKSFVAAARTRIDIKFMKVKAHSGNKNNERADKLAKEALGL